MTEEADGLVRSASGPRGCVDRLVSIEIFGGGGSGSAVVILVVLPLLDAAGLFSKVVSGRILENTSRTAWLGGDREKEEYQTVDCFCDVSPLSQGQQESLLANFQLSLVQNYPVE